MKKLKTMGYVIIICSVCAVIFATIKDIPIEKEAIVSAEVIALYYLFRGLISLDNK